MATDFPSGVFDPAQWQRRIQTAEFQWRPWVPRVIGVVLALFLLFTVYYQIEPEEVGVVTRFGQYSRTTQPGPHFKWPFGIERVIKVPVQRQLKEEFGYRTVTAGVRTDYERNEETSAESLMLTGDLNVANVEWIVQYRIKQPYNYVFRVRNVRQTFRDMAEASMRKVVGDHNVTEVLTVGREAIQIKARDQLQALCNQYETGIEVLQLVLQDVNPPEPVRPSFNEVNQSMQERERAINQAWSRYNQVIPEARGKALQELRSAEGYATARVNRAQGDVQRFLAVEHEYAKSPDVTKTRLYLETMTEVIPKAQKRVVIDSSLKNLVPLFNMQGKAP